MKSEPPDAKPSRRHRPAGAALPSWFPTVLAAVLSLVQSGLIVWFGFKLTGQVELVLKEREATRQAATAMTDLVEQMQSNDTDIAAQRAIVRRLTMFGADAVGPLMLLAIAPGPYSEERPLDGLRMLSVLHRQPVCDAVALAARSRDVIDAARRQGIVKLKEQLAC